ncbi:MAG: bifunctional folylpolyglutamate synthase/dihydrofolate synthase [Acidimicrobiales bacterium]
MKAWKVAPAASRRGWSRGEALGWLEAHVNLEAVVGGTAPPPTLGRMVELTGLLGRPQEAYPVVHLTGTNGKGSTARMLTSLLSAKGLRVGTYTSPDLERLNERMAVAGEPISDDELAEVLARVADAEPAMAVPPSRFEILTAAALSWFADVAADVAVVEVGLGGRHDATNVVDAQVAAVTNVSLDHAEIIGPTLADIASEKAGIVKPGSTFVLGETDPPLRSVFLAEAEQVGSGPVWERGVEWDCGDNRMAHGGRLCDLRTPGTTYPEVFVPLHGAHQGDNAAVALAAAEAFFAAPLDREVVDQGFAAARSPGRMEVVGRAPLVVLDGAHNPAGAAAAAATLDEELDVPGRRIVVVGLLRGRQPGEMLAALGHERMSLVVACRPPSPRALAPVEVVAAARGLGVEAEVVADVGRALDRAMAVAGEEDLVLVTGSLYVVGQARALLLGHGWHHD